MKRLLLVLTLLLLLLSSGTLTLGAIHNSNGDFSYFGNPLAEMIFSMATLWGEDTWFSIEPDEPSVTGGYFGTSTDTGENVNIFAVEYYLNDFLFAGLGSASTEASDETMVSLAGSYLFDFGLFLGLNYISISDGADESGYIFSPGYAFKFDDDSYIALSFDYVSIEDLDEIVGYDLDGKYLTDTLKFVGQYYLPTDEYGVDVDPFYELAVNFAVSDQITVGIVVAGDGDDTLTAAGLTWIGDLLIFDAAFGSESETDMSYYDLSAIFKFNDSFGAGLEYLSLDDVDDAQIIVKFRYATDESEFSLNYGLENDSWATMYNLVYEQKL